MFCHYKFATYLLLDLLIFVSFMGSHFARGQLDDNNNETVNMLSRLLGDVDNVGYEDAVEFVNRSVGIADGLLKALKFTIESEYLIKQTFQEYEKMSQLCKEEGHALNLKYMEFSNQLNNLNNFALQLGKAKYVNDLSKCAEAQETFNEISNGRATYFEKLIRIQGSSSELFTKTREANTLLAAVVRQLSGLINNESGQVSEPHSDLDSKVEALDLEKYTDMDMEHDNLKAVDGLVREIRIARIIMTKVAEHDEDFENLQLDNMLELAKSVAQVSRTLKNVLGEKKTWDFIQKRFKTITDDLGQLTRKVTSTKTEVRQSAIEILKAAENCDVKVTGILNKFLQSQVNFHGRDEL